MFHIIIINIFYNISVKLLFCADQGLDSSLECKGKKRIFMCHVFIKFSDLLGLCCQEIVMLQQFSDLQKEITVHQINFIVAGFGIFAEVAGIFSQNPKYPRNTGNRLKLSCVSPSFVVNI